MRQFAAASRPASSSTFAASAALTDMPSMTLPNTSGNADVLNEVDGMPFPVAAENVFPQIIVTEARVAPLRLRCPDRHEGARDESHGC